MLLLCLRLSVKLSSVCRIMGRIHQHRRFSVNNLQIQRTSSLLLPSRILLLKEMTESQYSKTNFSSACSCCGPLTTLWLLWRQEQPLCPRCIFSQGPSTVSAQHSTSTPRHFPYYSNFLQRMTLSHLQETIESKDV